MSNLSPSFEVQFEFADGSIDLRTTPSLAFKGIRNNNGSRPVYITLTCMSTQADYILDNYVIKDIDNFRYILAECDSLCYRVTIKPYWFYKQIRQTKGML